MKNKKFKDKDFIEAIGVLFSSSLPVKAAMEVAKVYQSLHNQKASYEKRISDEVEKYCVTEDGRTVVKEGMLQEFQSAILALDEEEFDVGKISIESLGDIVITPKQLLMLQEILY